METIVWLLAEVIVPFVTDPFERWLYGEPERPDPDPTDPVGSGS